MSPTTREIPRSALSLKSRWTRTRTSYDDGWEDNEFAVALGEVRALIDLLDAAERELPLDLEPPTARHYRRRHGLVPTESE